MFSKRTLGIGAALTLALSIGSGCAPEGSARGVPTEQEATGESPLKAGLPFVAIERERSEGEYAAQLETLSQLGMKAAALSLPKHQFYVAVHRSALKKPWFMNAFLNDSISTDSLTAGGAQSIGTDVVELRLQNDKLYVFSADARRQWSDAIDPEVIIEAYPVVTRFLAFDKLPGADQYILIDPTGGLNRLAFTSDIATSEYPTGEPSARLRVDLAYSQAFTEIADGVSFEVVLAGAVEGIGVRDLAIVESGLSATLTLSFREYKEGEGFEPFAAPETEHYFLSARAVQRDTEQVLSPYALKWNLHPGMAPIEWLITPNVQTVASALPSEVLTGAIARGVESWNKVLGFPAFKARLATPQEKVGRDDKSFIVVDSDLAAGAAFASPRSNPNTGEIRGASVYLPAAFFASNFFADDAEPAPLADEETETTALRARFGQLSPPASTCALKVDRKRGPIEGTPLPALAAARTKEEKLEAYVQHVVAHEVGHALGLRHNFKGSLVPPTSSVMEYSRAELAAQVFEPAAYDVEAIQYLYGLSEQAPSSPFCNDDEMGTDPTCMQADFGADPLNQAWAPSYAWLVSSAAQLGTIAPLEAWFDTYATPIVSFVRAGDEASAGQAWTILTESIAAPLDPALAADPAYAAMADELMQWLLTRIYLLPAPLRAGGAWEVVPTADPSDPALVAGITRQLSALLTNVDGVRSYALRRMAVDVLRGMQSTSALSVLAEAKAALEAELESGSLGHEDALLTGDLVRRIDAAMSPYFD